MSILEVSHRSKPFEDILAGCEADLRTLAGIPDGYRVLFLQGGASLQFAMVPLNLLLPGQTADIVHSGAWAEKAVKEAKVVDEVVRHSRIRGPGRHGKIVKYRTGHSGVQPR